MSSSAGIITVKFVIPNGGKEIQLNFVPNNNIPNITTTWKIDFGDNNGYITGNPDPVKTYTNDTGSEIEKEVKFQITSGAMSAIQIDADSIGYLKELTVGNSTLVKNGTSYETPDLSWGLNAVFTGDSNSETGTLLDTTYNVTSLEAFFQGATRLTTVPGHLISGITNLLNLFNYASAFNQPIGNWNVGNVTNMQRMFSFASAFNQPLEQWNVSNVTRMDSMFENAYAFNQPIGNWNVGNVTDIYGMFREASAFNQPIGDWDVSNVTTMSFIFFKATAFNQPIGQWNVSNVTRMESVFFGASSFNQPIGDWDVSNVTTMTYMFQNASAFNQPIGEWDVSQVTDMRKVFHGAVSFNQPIGQWDVSAVTDIKNMFNGAASFNQDINAWDVSNIRLMYGMFMNAYKFNQDISSWNVSTAVNMTDMFSGSVTFTNHFGGATLVTENFAINNTKYEVQTRHDLQPWAGFAVTEGELNLPLKFTNAGTITFNAYTSSNVNIKFRFEKDLFVASNNEDPKQTTNFYETSEVTIIPTTTSYSITIPSQGLNEFNNVMLYVVTRDVPVTINAVIINNDTPNNKMSFDQNINIWKVQPDTSLLYMFSNTGITSSNSYGFTVPTPTFDEFNQNMKLKGDNPATAEKGLIYVDPGVVLASDVTNLTTDSNLDTENVGTYYITYRARDSENNEISITRAIFVKDTTSPIITSKLLSAIENGETALGSVVANESVTWYVDNDDIQIDSNGVVSLKIAANLKIKPFYRYTITAKDDSNNIKTISQKVNVYNTPEIDEYNVILELSQNSFTDDSLETASQNETLDFTKDILKSYYDNNNQSDKVIKLMPPKDGILLPGISDEPIIKPIMLYDGTTKYEFSDDDINGNTVYIITEIGRTIVVGTTIIRHNADNFSVTINDFTRIKQRGSSFYVGGVTLDKFTLGSIFVESEFIDPNACSCISQSDPLNNAILDDVSASPAKDSTSDGGNSFSILRNAFRRTYYPVQPAKKEIYGDKDASVIVRQRTMNETSRTLNAVGLPMSFTNGNDSNLVRRSVQRTRNSGGVPNKVAKRGPFQ